LVDQHNLIHDFLVNRLSNAFWDFANLHVLQKLSLLFETRKVVLFRKKYMKLAIPAQTFVHRPEDL